MENIQEGYRSLRNFPRGESKKPYDQPAGIYTEAASEPTVVPRKERKESSSEFEDDDGDDSSEGYCIYENTNDVHYYNVSSETSDFIGEGGSEDEEPVTNRNVRRKAQRRTLAKIELSQESRYSVISVKPYKAMTFDELDFPKEKKFEVVGQETKRWLIGEIGGKRGLFPAEYVKRIDLADNETLTQDLTVYSVIAIQSYKGKSYDEISFRKEDKFNVVGQESERWLVGEVNGNRGLFPAEYVKISFQKEDKFIVVGEKSSGWLIGEIHGKKGLFPSEYVKVCTPLSRQKQMFEWMLSA
ncbi:Hypothetical predicted protein [Mytilus galloprovincialis]|uniref:SH3 domain-containing protein n=1 Tax=Mytilus galloprovincialis TaxID=29158 RepID=A0A8B6BQX2_MYTGA|nr:Hypothetical predicted protein [Mytilus galloprovincialis]